MPRLNTEEIIKRLRNPAQYRKADPAAAAKQKKEEQTAKETARKKNGPDLMLLGVTFGIGFLLFITVIFFISAKNKAENLAAALDPTQVKGLMTEKEFNPRTGVTYMQIQEGQDRNVAVENLGSTLPVISRFNFRTLTKKEQVGDKKLSDYEIIGAAPWALTTNFSSNISDPKLMRYLLDVDEVAKAFMAREDVAPLLEDPQLLQSFTEDQAAMKDFFEHETVKSVFANEEMVRAVAGSRFMSHLLISRSLKYFRQHPQEAAAIIDGNPYLADLRRNPAVQTAVKENPYLKKIADVLLKEGATSAPAAAAAQPASAAAPAQQKKKKGKKK